MIAFIEAQGSLLSMRVTGFKPRQSNGGHKRGIIQTFSQASRRRLMRFMARLKVRKIRATFITLTFSKVVTNERAKLVFKRFAARLRRAFPRASAVWRLEFQERGAIHFHLLVFNLDFWKQALLQRTWEACTEEERSIADIRLVHGSRSIMSYISKYIAKPDERSEITSLDDGSYQHGSAGGLVGRSWGYINKELLPLGEVVAGVLTDRQTIKSISSLVWSILANGNPYNSLSFHLFCDNARWLCERAIEEGGCLVDEWEYTVKDHSTHKPTHSPYTEHFSERELSMTEPIVFGRLSKGERSSACEPFQPIKRAVMLSLFAAQVVADFELDGTIVTINPLCKEQDHAAL